MTHLWSVSASQAAGLSVAYCGERIDKLKEGDSIREQGPIDCATCRLREPGEVAYQAAEESLQTPVDWKGAGFEQKRFTRIVTRPELAGRATAILAAAQAASPKEARISFLERKREATKADLLLKFEDGDWHGTADAAMDLRDIDSELKGLRF